VLKRSSKAAAITMAAVGVIETEVSISAGDGAHLVWLPLEGESKGQVLYSFRLCLREAVSQSEAFCLVLPTGVTSQVERSSPLCRMFCA
jgi:hypothetical protein